MPRKCTVCIHPQRTEIEKALLDGESYQSIADRFGLSKTAVGSHKRNGHIEQHIAEAKKAEEIADADDLLARLEMLLTQTEHDSLIARAVLQALLNWLDIDIDVRAGKPVPRSEARKNPEGEKLRPVIEVKTGPNGGKALVFAGKHVLECVESLRRYSDTMTRQLETIARVSKVIEEKAEVNVNILLQPQWVELRAVIVQALHPHPQAKKALFEALTHHANDS